MPSDAPDAVIRRLQRLADRGSADAQHRLGRCYEDGASVSQDLVAAARWWRLAAAQGHAEARFDLGHLYAMGEGGVARDPAEAARLYVLAVEQGLSDAQYFLGRHYSQGDGVPQDFAEAQRLWRLAAAQGHSTAQYTLGLCAHYGTDGVALDLAEAARMYRLASVLGQTSAQNNLAALCYTGYDGAPPDLAEATRLWGLAAARGHAGARCHLAQLCAQGHAGAKDVVCGLAAQRDAPELAANVPQVRLAAARGDAVSQGLLGSFYALGIGGVAQDYAEGVRLLRLGAAQGDAHALHTLGFLYKHGDGVPRDYVEAARFFRLAAAQGSGDTRSVLAARSALAELSSKRAYVAACCSGCGATRQLKTCAKCKVARFCGPECVRRAWAEHKPHCKRWEAEKAV